MSEFDHTKDYFKELRKDEILEKDGKEFVFLRGLERLAKERGVKLATSQVIATPTRENPCAVVTYGYGFADGAHYEASADASTSNCDKGFNRYLTAMAESRAKARALRTAFGISACSVEEIANNPEDDLNSISVSDEQKLLINHLAKKHELSISEVLSFNEREVKTIDELTRGESISLINRLNRAKPRREIAKRK